MVPRLAATVWRHRLKPHLELDAAVLGARERYCAAQLAAAPYNVGKAQLQVAELLVRNGIAVWSQVKPEKEGDEIRARADILD